MENKTQTPVNHIKVSFKSSVKSLVNYAEKVLKEHNMRTLQFTAIGGAIGNLVMTAEVLKVLHPGLYQTNTLGTVVHQTLENEKSVNERLYPKFEVEMSLDAPTKTTEGTQDKITEELQKQIESFKATAAAKPREERPARGGRGAPRGRGGRGAPRGGRGGVARGGRGAPRGGRGGVARGGRGAPRGGRGGYEQSYDAPREYAPRGAARGRGAPRGGPRGAPRGGRGAPRGAPRGGRGAPRGAPRGGSAPRGRGGY